MHAGAYASTDTKGLEMAGLSAEQIRGIVARFIPASIQSNIFVKSLLAGAAAIGVLVMTPAFAPVGVVGATGWIIVYVVTGGTLSYELIKAAWEKWTLMSPEQREHLEKKLEILKKAHDDGAISEEEYKQRAKMLLDEMLGQKKR